MTKFMKLKRLIIVFYICLCEHASLEVRLGLELFVPVQNCNSESKFYISGYF